MKLCKKLIIELGFKKSNHPTLSKTNNCYSIFFGDMEFIIANFCDVYTLYYKNNYNYINHDSVCINTQEKLEKLFYSITGQTIKDAKQSN